MRDSFSFHISISVKALYSLGAPYVLIFAGGGTHCSQAKLWIGDALLDLFEHLVAELAKCLTHVLYFLLNDLCFTYKVKVVSRRGDYLDTYI